MAPVRRRHGPQIRYKWLEALAWERGRPGTDGYLNSWCQVIDPSWRWTDLEMATNSIARGI